MNQSIQRLPFSDNTTFANNTFLSLEVSRGKTKFPHRPITESRFVIGSGSGCDMILGDAHVAEIHTILLVEGGRVIAEAVSHAPLLKVNGNVVSTAILEEGDVLTIGGFQFTVHLNHEAIARTLEAESDSLNDLIEAADDEEFDAADLSAKELVDRLEAEMAQVDRFERQLHTGHAALLQAAINRNTSREQLPEFARPSAAPQRMIHSGHALRGPRSRAHFAAEDRFVDEFERVRLELEDFSTDLVERIQQVNHREDSIDAATKELAEAQNKLVAQLGLLLEQIASQQTTDPPRAIA